MANYYMLGGDGKEYGPTSAEQLRQWVAEGRANAQTQVRAAEGGSYMALGVVPELNSNASSATPAAFQPSSATSFAQSQGSSDYFMRGGDGKEYGPVSAQQLRQWVAEGRANTQTLVRAANGGPFLALGMVPELNSPTGARPVSSHLAQALAHQSTLSGGDEGAQVKRLASVLAAGSGWIRTLAVLMFMLAGLLCLTIVGIIVAWLPLWQGIVLWSGATRAQQAVFTGSEQDLLQALEKVRQSFRLGVILLVVLVICYLILATIGTMIMGGLPNLGNGLR